MKSRFVHKNIFGERFLVEKVDKIKDLNVGDWVIGRGMKNPVEIQFKRRYRILEESFRCTFVYGDNEDEMRLNISPCGVPFRADEIFKVLSWSRQLLIEKK